MSLHSVWPPLRNLQFAMCIWQVAILIGLTCPLRLTAADSPHSPVSPADSVKHLVVPTGLRVELAAHEPQVIDPVAIRFDEDGRMWVVEMRDYPTADTKGVVAPSRISVLTDRDGDGFFESAAVFADNLHYATGLQPWKGGVFVTMAGQVAYMKDTTGDDKADLMETWYTGFAQKNTQLRANHPQLGLDNHIYVANGLRGGEIVDARRPDAKPVSISGMDFRFDPRTRRYEAVSGVGQFGLTFDDYGNRFVCSNRNPAIHVVLEDRHLRKNPLVAVSAVSADVATAGADSRVYPIGRSWTTSHLHAGQFTAACGLRIYRGDALPRAFYGNIFVCDPTAHIVHREIMKPRGVTFTSKPAEVGAEFLASRDEWFSPVNLETGPDGALYVVDMYRAVIEHPHWMPTELRQRPDLMLGNDLGRIYRIVPEDFGAPAAPRLSALPATSLVEFLAHPNVWWRETAARLLLERDDKSVASQLERVATGHESNLARIHALRLLDGLGLLHIEIIRQLLKDSNPRVLEQAIIAAESRIDESRQLRERISQLAAHEDARVRFHALLMALPMPPAPAFPADRWESDAMLVAVGQRGGAALERMLHEPARLKRNIGEPKRFVADLARMAAASRDDRQVTAAVKALAGSPEYLRVGLTGLLRGASERMSVDTLISKLDGATQREFHRAIVGARNDAANDDREESVRCEAIDLLGALGEATDALLPIALGDSSQPVRLKAIAALSKSQDIEPWVQLLEGFSRETPAIQRAILDGVIAAPARASLLVEEIAAGRIRPTELDVNYTKLLLNYRDPAIKSRAEELLVLPADREQALAEYRVVLTMKSDPARGRGVFEKHCATCHQIDGVGIAFAPDISDSREKTAEQLLTDIIQPNRAIDSNYFSYTAVTVDGLVHTGVLAAETSTSVTLKQAEGKSVTLRRDAIEQLRSDGVSFMADGLEKNIPPQDMADLIAFIKHWRYLKDGIDLPAALP